VILETPEGPSHANWYVVPDGYDPRAVWYMVALRVVKNGHVPVLRPLTASSGFEVSSPHLGSLEAWVALVPGM